MRAQGSAPPPSQQPGYHTHAPLSRYEQQGPHRQHHSPIHAPFNPTGDPPNHQSYDTTRQEASGPPNHRPQGEPRRSPGPSLVYPPPREASGPPNHRPQGEGYPLCANTRPGVPRQHHSPIHSPFNPPGDPNIMKRAVEARYDTESGSFPYWTPSLQKRADQDEDHWPPGTGSPPPSRESHQLLQRQSYDTTHQGGIYNHHQPPDTTRQEVGVPRNHHLQSVAHLPHATTHHHPTSVPRSGFHAVRKKITDEHARKQVQGDPSDASMSLIP
jgi:hypothetical protein